MILEKLIQSYHQSLVDASYFAGGVLRRERLHSVLGSQPPLIVLHDLDDFSVRYVNDLAQDAFSFQGNWLLSNGIYQYINLFHPDSVYTLVESYHFFRRREKGFLNLSFQMKFKEGYRSVLSTTKTIAWGEGGEPRFALTILSTASDLKELEVFGLDGVDRLKSRQLEVLTLMLKGHSNGEIGAALGISSRTVEKHVKLVLEATGCQSRIALVQAVH